MRFDGLVCPIDGNQRGLTAGIYGILRTVVGRQLSGFPTLEAATKYQGRSSILKALNAPYGLSLIGCSDGPLDHLPSSSTARGLTKQYCFGFVGDDRLPIDLTSALVGTLHRRPRSYGPEPTLQMRKLV